MAVALISSVSCSLCTRRISEEEVKQFGLGSETSGYVCLECRTRDQRAQYAFSMGLSKQLMDAPPDEMRCPECKRTLGEIRKVDHTDSIYAHHLPGGEIRWMCPRCSEGFAATQALAQIYKATEYGARGFVKPRFSLQALLRKIWDRK